MHEPANRRFVAYLYPLLRLFFHYFLPIARCLKEALPRTHLKQNRNQKLKKQLATLRQKLFMSKAKPFQIIQSLAATLVFVKVKNKLISVKALNSPTTMLLSCTVVGWWKLLESPRVTDLTIRNYDVSIMFCFVFAAVLEVLMVFNKGIKNFRRNN